MKKSIVVFISLIFLLLTACGRGNDLADGTYSYDITMTGGSGKAKINSPITVTVENGDIYAALVWSSKNYDYMIVDGKRYDNENEGGYSTFTIPVEDLSVPLSVIADTVAMSTPHEIEYVITFEGSADQKQSSFEADTDEAKEAGDASQEDGQMPAYNKDEFRALADSYGGYEKTGVLELSYAKGFEAGYYGPYTAINVKGYGTYLLVPEGEKVPEDLPEDVAMLQKPLDHTYLVSTSVMDLICATDSLEMIRFSGLDKDGWYIDKAKAAMDKGEILYAGKYRAPDYELLLSEGCNFAIENTMIYHKPEVLDKLKEVGIPVLVETSSYEDDPLGRLEWIKLYGMLFDRSDEAEKVFSEQEQIINDLRGKESSGKSVAFFHVTASGMINVRRPGDYIVKMIEQSGGKYLPGDIGDDSDTAASMNMQMEDFYNSCRDADMIIYNSTIAGKIDTADELVKKNALFADFEAVKNGQVYCTTEDLFQKTTAVAGFMKDLRNLFDCNDEDYEFLRRLK